MTETADRWLRIAGTFTDRVDHVTSTAWSNPSPCEGWTARDIVKHLTDWVPPFLDAGAHLDVGNGPSVEVDPAAAWHHLDRAILAVLDSPDIDDRTFDHPYAGQHRLDEAIDRFILGDVLIHTWDLARATGQAEQLDPSMVTAMLAGLEPIVDVLASSGQYGPRVAVPHDATPQTKLLALTGRRAA